MKFKGLLLRESLEDISVLAKLKIVGEEKWDIENASPDQPRTWQAITYEGSQTEAKSIAAKLALAFKSGPWYTNFTAKSSVFIVFPGKVFAYRKGSLSGRKKAEAWAKSIGIPQIN